MIDFNDFDIDETRSKYKDIVIESDIDTDVYEGLEVLVKDKNIKGHIINVIMVMLYHDIFSGRYLILVQHKTDSKRKYYREEELLIIK